MSEVFLSYSRVDEGFAARLEVALLERGRGVWRDRQNIPKAEPWRQEIRIGIEESEKVIFILSPHFAGSAECLKELACAVELKKRLIPVLHRDPAAENREVPPALRELNYFPFLPDAPFEPTVDELVRTLDFDAAWTRRHAQIGVAAARWEQDAGSPARLWRGEPLRDAEAALAVAAAGKQPGFTPLQARFIAASRQAEAERATRWQTLYREAQARALAASARNHIATAPDLALLLAVAAVERRENAESIGVLLAGLAHHAHLSRCLHRHRTAISGLGWDSTGRLLSTDHGSHLGLSPAGSEIASTLIVWDAASGAVLGDRTFAHMTAAALGGGHAVTAAFRRCDVEPQEHGFVVLRHDEFDRRLRGRGGQSGFGGMVKALSLRPDGWLLATGDELGNVDLWRMEDLGHVGRLEFGEPIAVLAWLSAERLLVATERSRELHLVEWPGAKIRPLGQFAERIAALATSASGRFAVLTQHGPFGKLHWAEQLDAAFREVLITEHGAAVRAIWLPPDGRAAFTAGGGGSIEGAGLIRWDLDSGKPAWIPLHAFERGLTHLAGDPAGEWLAAGRTDGQILVWNLDRPEAIPAWDYCPVDSPCCALAAIPGSGAFLAGHRDGSVRRITAAPSGGSQQLVATGDSPVVQLACLPDAQRFVTVRADGSIEIVSISDGRASCQAGSPRSGPVSALAVSPDGETIALGRADGTIALLSTGRLEEIARLEDSHAGPRIEFTERGTFVHPEPGAAVTGLAFHPVLPQLLAARADGAVQAWNPTAPDDGPRLVRNGGSITAGGVAISADGACCVSYGDMALQLWRESPAEPVHLEGHTDPALAFAFAGGGQRMVSASCQEMLLWQADASAPLGRVPVRSGLAQLAASTDGRWLLGRDHDGRLQGWDLSIASWIQLARRKANRSLTNAEQERYVGELPADEEAPV